MANRAVYRAIWVTSTIALIVLIVLFSRQTMAVPKPDKMATYVTDDKVVRVQHPSNWKGHAISANAVATTVWFQPAPTARFRVMVDLKGSLLADISKSSGGMELPTNLPGMDQGNGQQPSSQSPLEKVHAMQGEEMQSSPLYPQFQDGTTAPAQIAGLDALATDYTYQQPGLWGSTPIVGKRFTALSGDRRITVVYECAKDTQAELAPVFTKMLDSLQIGQGGS
ncbi:MAG TPA: hypothetical protein VFA07_07405 [Chthonomonadaceae bacterium]|nr:hypothetical protein [Chthonomonadaceae bacterium]